MKKIYSLLGILFFTANAFAQNVGVNNTDPQVALDVQGALRNRPTSFNIATTPIVVTSNIGFVILTGTNTLSPTLTVTGGNDGTRILVKNTTNQSCKFPAGSKDVPINTLVEYVYADGVWQWIASSIVNATWDIKGNSVIDSTTDFIGTLSNQPIIFKTGNIERMKLNSNGTFSTQGNMGIGTATPSTKLEIKNAVKATTKISSNSFNDTSQLIFSNRSSINLGTDILLTNIREDGLRISSSSDLTANTKDTIMQITPQGNVGIRTAAPAYPLDVKGDVNTTGLMRINGNSGVAGQVLTSNGSAPPNWQEAERNYPALDRMMVQISSATILTASPLVFLVTDYNLNPSNFSIATTGITVNTTGLYEIEGSVFFIANSIIVESGRGPYCTLTFKTTNGASVKSYYLAREQIDASSIAVGNFNEVIPYKIKIHLVAGTVISLEGSISLYTSVSGTNIGVAGGHIGIIKVN
jgi:sporulation protein YlmC with PRC-barrel domain